MSTSVAGISDAAFGLRPEMSILTSASTAMALGLTPVGRDPADQT